MKLRVLLVSAAILLVVGCSEASGGPGTYRFDSDGLTINVDIPADPEGYAAEYLEFAKDNSGDTALTWVRVTAVNDAESSKSICPLIALDEEGVRANSSTVRDLVLEVWESIPITDVGTGYNDGVRLINELNDIPDVGEILPGEKRVFYLAFERAALNPSKLFGGQGYACDAEAKKVA